MSITLSAGSVPFAVSRATAEPLVSGQRTDVLKATASVLSREHRGGLFQYHGTSQDSAGSVEVLLQPAGKLSRRKLPVVEALRELFALNADVSVNEQRGGLIVMTNQHVWNALSDVKIGRVDLRAGAQYDPDLAIDALLSEHHVQDAMEQLKIQYPFTMGRLVGSHGGNSPHLPPGSLDNGTFEQALEKVASTFKGLLVYVECLRPDGTHLVDIYFLEGRVRGE